MSEQHTIALTEQRQRIKDKAVRTIFVRFQKEGIHNYPAAATDPNLATGDEYDVSFLATPHRHIFHFEVTIEVFHNDRDIEFIQFKRWLENQYSQGILALDYKSCEMISDDLYDVIATQYPNRNVVIQVSEDNENGATIVYNTHQPYQSLAI
jgi:N-acetyl-gamma-glutamylphosphate reductase